MGLQECQIIFDNEWATYYAGQTVNGRVEIYLDTPKKVRGIKIAFKGECTTQWAIEESRTNNEGKSENERIDLRGQEEYFKINYYLLGSGSGETEIDLPAGQLVYPFTCVLPPTLPSSFEGEFGHVRYTVKVTLDRPWKFDQEVKAAFTVLSPVDLNVNPKNKDPVRITMEKFFCCCWCKSGPLTCVVLLPCSGFVPGQTIPVTCELDNISNVEILNVQFSLQKAISYHSQIPRRETKRDVIILEQITVGPVPAHGSKTWKQPISIPPLPPSVLTNCSLIDLDYELLVEVRVSGFHHNMKTKVPIMIGTIPLQGPPPTAPPSESVAVNMNPQQNSDFGWVNSNNGLYPTLPPVFMESQFGTKNIQDSTDNEYTRYSNNTQHYSPMYPVYNTGTNQQ